MNKLAWLPLVAAVLSLAGCSGASPASDTEESLTIDAEYEQYFGPGSANEYFGRVVCVNGSYAIVGCSTGGGSEQAGKAYIYELGEDGTWTQVASFSDSKASDMYAASVSISSDGYAMVGAPGYNSYTGAVFVYERGADGTWTNTATLDGTVTYDRFGCSVSMDGGYAIVGAYGVDYSEDESTLSDRGAAYVYERGSSEWTLVSSLKASNYDESGDDYAYFGYSVAITSSGYALVGAMGHDSFAGAAYFFERGSGGWTQASLISGSSASDNLGYSVSVSGSYAVVGVSGYDSSAGAAYVYKRGSSGWTQKSLLTASDGASGDGFGYTVSITSDGCAVVGAPNATVSNLAYAGCAYAFARGLDGSWTQAQKLTISDAGLSVAAYACFGVSVSVSAGQCMVGDGNYSSGKGMACVWSLY